MDLRISWTRKALELPPEARAELERRLEILHRFFPEMSREMKIGITRAYDGLAFQSDEGRVKLMVDIHWSRLRRAWKLPTYWTLGHELMHLAQFNAKGIPGGERACDIYALSRLAPEFVDDSPSYLVVPPRIRRKWNLSYARLARTLAREALRKRSKGLRRYISWWEVEFERRAAKPLANTGRPYAIGANLLRTSRAEQHAPAPLDVARAHEAERRERD